MLDTSLRLEKEGGTEIREPVVEVVFGKAPCRLLIFQNN